MSLLDAINSARQALTSQQYALEITQRNIANVNTDGYSRERVEFSPGDLTGNTPTVSVVDFRNRLIDYSVSQETQVKGELETLSSGIRQIDSVLNETGGGGLQNAISSFFNTFSALANAPEEMSLRRQVLSRGEALAGEFKRIEEGLLQIQDFQNRGVSDTVGQINTLVTRIAALNARISQPQGIGSDAEYALKDERQRAIEQLSGLMDISYFEDESNAVTVATKGGATLVVGDSAQTLDVMPSTVGPFAGIELDGMDITSSIQSGVLGGQLKLRDAVIPGYLSSLDDLAAGIVARVNEQHMAGTDLDGNAGMEFFAPFNQPYPGSNSGAARSMMVALGDPRRVAAGAASTGPGNNENALLLSGIQRERIFAGFSETATEYYAGFIAKVGIDERETSDRAQTQAAILDQLLNQRDSISGVNLDEEAANILKFQRAYQGSARLISVLDSLTEEVIRLLG
jgi:flagellar hook-associated protein 1